MGQRLVISIMSDGETVANAYYHWSAYTGSAAGLTGQICSCYRWLKNECTSDFELAVRLLQGTGAGVSKDEWQNIEETKDSRVNTVELRDCENRNVGILCVTPEGKEDNNRWAEGNVDIDLNRETVSFYVYSSMPKEEYDAEYAEFYDGLNEIDDIPLFFDCPIDEFWKACETIEQNPGGCICGDTVFLWIE